MPSVSPVQSSVRALTAVIYLRVSTADQGRNGFSLPEQRKACTEKARDLARAAERETGASVALELAEFVDTHGGDILQRPGLEQVRRFVRESRPRFFICLDPDRFSRSTYQAIFVADEIESAGTKLEFIQHDYQNTSEGRLFFTLRVAIAEYEKAKILERTARGRRGKMASGGIPHFMRAYGYDFLGGTGQLSPHPVEAVWVRQMYRWVLQEDLGSQGIAERLNTMGVPAKNGGLWHRGVVAEILRNPTYAGELRLNRYDFGGLGQQSELPKERRTRKLTPKLRPPGEWITVAVPPLLPREEFDAVQRCLQGMARRSGTRAAPGRRGHLLSGIVTCGLCGAPMYYVWNNRVTGYLLRCANRYPGARGMRVPPPACRSPFQKAEIFERATWARVQEWLTDPELLRSDLERRAGEPDERREAADQRRSALKGQLDEVKARQSRVLHLAGKGIVHEDVAAEQLEELMRQIGALERELQGAVAETNASSKADEAVGSPEALRRLLLADLESLELPARQGVVRMLVNEVRVFPGGKADILPSG